MIDGEGIQERLAEKVDCWTRSPTPVQYADVIAATVREYGHGHVVFTGCGDLAEVVALSMVTPYPQIRGYEYSMARWERTYETRRHLRPRALLVWGESGDAVADIFHCEGKPAVFWLDAHVFRDEEMARGDVDEDNVLRHPRTEWNWPFFPLKHSDGTLELTPVLRELRTIGNHPLSRESVVIIPRMERYDQPWDGYPNTGTLLEVAAHWFPAHRAQRQGDIMRIVPKEPRR